MNDRTSHDTVETPGIEKPEVDPSLRFDTTDESDAQPAVRHADPTASTMSGSTDEVLGEARQSPSRSALDSEVDDQPLVNDKITPLDDEVDATGLEVDAALESTRTSEASNATSGD